MKPLVKVWASVDEITKIHLRFPNVERVSLQGEHKIVNLSNFPGDLYELLKQMAKLNRLSVSTLVVVILTKVFDRALKS